ncbi:MAG: UDP-N-acetylmuramyl-tripeptide synthetase [Candidatus Shapirobacteria bacterium]|nr:UDP-N-acetylmuramyl-tripeptide synthetase [Candidatus Shapirobacteria bacterium]
MTSKSIKFFFQKIKNTFWHLPKNFFINLKYGFPSKKLILIGITGTDGKTTTCHLVHHVLTASGLKAGLISTNGAIIGNTNHQTKLHMTSPDPKIIQNLLQKMVKEKVTHVVLEVTAHGLDQSRFLLSSFDIAAITNTSIEHLDYFKNIDQYIKTKAKIFNQSKISILNKDDQSFDIIKPILKNKPITFSIKNPSDYQAKNIKITNQKLQFNVNNIQIITDSPYQYQIYNILTAFAICNQLNINPSLFVNSVKKFPQIKGRREEVKNNFKFKTIVDFAHTPAALENTLLSLKKNTQGNLITIFGATGGRDPSKRPLMGNVVSKISNIAIITADDTRNEKIEDINNQIIAGITNKNTKLVNHLNLNQRQINQIVKDANKYFIYFNVPNRQDAFNLAIKLAQPNDTIVACGKGHEDTILHGKTEYPWSETEAFRTAFNLKTHD